MTNSKSPSCSLIIITPTTTITEPGTNAKLIRLVREYIVIRPSGQAILRRTATGARMYYFLVRTSEQCTSSYYMNCCDSVGSRSMSEIVNVIYTHKEWPV